MIKKIAQLVHTLSYGDAISTEVLSIHRVCEELGFESTIYAINEHPKLKNQSRKYTELPPDFSGEVILHYSLGSPLNDLYRQLVKAKRTLIYHNLTPAHFFSAVNPRIVRDINTGLEELPGLLKITDRIISDSQFNAAEIVTYGFQSEVLEIPFDPSRWEMPANPGIAAQIKGDSALHIVHVGRLAPNKKIEELIKTLYVMREHVNRNVRLWLVGIDIDTELYSFSLKRLINFLGLEQEVRLVGCFADSEVRALYENADVYVCLSEHEGYCLPVIEAMHFGLPVITSASSALPQTVGTGGVVVEQSDYLELALLINAIGTDPEFKQKLRQSGFERIKSLSMENFKKNISVLFS
jgi:glycosyltransferase involved in cell wall biosynthesis